ncbi:hypothetical protein D3C80_1209680 [compost metagenome]
MARLQYCNGLEMSCVGLVGLVLQFEGLLQLAFKVGMARLQRCNGVEVGSVGQVGLAL